MSKISLKHSGGNVVSLNSPTNAPGAADVAFKLPNTDGSAGQFMKTDGSGNLSFDTISAPSSDFVKLSNVNSTTNVTSIDFQSLDITTYKAFKLVFAGIPATDSQEVRFQFMSGSNVISSSYYAWALIGVSGSSAHYEEMALNDSTARIHNGAGNASLEGWRFVMDIVMQTTNDYAGANNYACWAGNRVDPSGNYRLENGTLYYEYDTDTDGFKLVTSSGDFDKYSYTLYGVKR